MTAASLEAIDDLYRSLGGAVLGIVPDQIASSAGAGAEAQLMELLIRLRAEARVRKDWAMADAIRNDLTRIGIALEDRLDGTTWRLS